MKNLTMSWVGVACSLALSACSGGSDEASATKMYKQLDYVACDKPNPVPDEVKLIADTGINPVKRRCNFLGVVSAAVVLQCGSEGFYSFSVLDVLPSEVAKAKSIGYTEQLQAFQTYDPANDVACD
jgi:hypothetical protein